MSKSKSKMRERRQRAADRYLAAWHQEIFEVVVEERDRRGLAPDGAAAEALAAEIARLAAPHSFRDLDAVVPGTRVDLARAWAHGRLDEVAPTNLRTSLRRRQTPISRTAWREAMTRTSTRLTTSGSTRFGI
jgi:hypothetical protein